MSESLPLPERPDLITGMNVSDLFAESIVRWREEIASVFNPDDNGHASWPPEDPRLIFKNFSKRPQLAVQMALELSTMILEIERDNNVLLNKKAYAHQLAHLKWLALSLLQDGSTYLIEGAPGTGKTLVLGALMQAATRLQMRGILNKAVIYATHRPFILAQQSFNAHDRRVRLMRPPDMSEVNQEMSYIQHLIGSEKLFPRNIWRNMRAQHYTREAAMQTLEDHLSQSEDGREFLSANSDLLDSIARLLSGDAVLVYDVDAELMQVPLSPAEVTDNEMNAYYSGDLGRGIPSSYVDEGLVASRRGADVNGLALDSKKSCPPLDTVRVLLTTVPTILTRHTRGSIADVLARTGIIIVDEGRHATTAFQDAVREVSGTSKKPLIFAASALSTTNGLASRPYADAYSPRLTIAAAMEPGPDGHQVLPNIGVDIFPGKGNVLYHSSTAEAVGQFIEAHFSDIPLAEQEDLPQPYMCTSIVVVSRETLAETVRMLRQEYAKRSIAADVIPFHNHPDKPSASNTKFPHSERVLQAMMDCPDDESQRRVRVLVACADTIRDALSIPTLQNVTVATASGINRNVLLRILGRLQHSNIHRTAGPAHRVYFRQGLYQDTKAEETVFQLLGGYEGSSMRWVQLQILKGDSGAQADIERVAGLPHISVPLSDEELHERREEKGMRVKTLELHRLHAGVNGHVPRTVAAEHVQLASMWNQFDAVIERALPTWHDHATRAAFCDIVLERLRASVAPTFMATIEVWPAWYRELMRLGLQHAANGPQAILDALKERVTSAAQLGRMEERESEIVPGEYVPLKDVELIDVDDEPEEFPDEEADGDDLNTDAIAGVEEALLAPHFEDEEPHDPDDEELFDSLHIDMHDLYTADMDDD